MNKYTLKFKDKKIETQYQEFRRKEILRKVFYTMTPSSLILNVIKVAVDLSKSKYDQLYVNCANIAVIIIGVLLVKINEKYLRFFITLCSVMTALLQLNLDPNDAQKQDYYNFGCVVTSLQSVLYFLSDFPDACIQVISHCSIRLSITSVTTNYVDFQDYLLTIFAMTFQFVVLYKCDFNSRKHFLLRVKENQWDNQLINLINSPFCQFKFINEELKFDLIQSKSVGMFFLIIISNFCERMVISRQYLRLTISLCPPKFRILLIQVQIYLKIINKKLKFINLGVETQKHLIILVNLNQEKNDHKFKKYLKQAKEEMYKTVKIFQKNDSEFQHSFRLGVYSMISLNSKQIKKINLTKRFQQCIKLFKLYGWKFKLKSNCQVYIYSYYCQINIFLIQLFLLFQNQKKQFQIQYFDLIESENEVNICIEPYDFQEFKAEFNTNFFINQIKNKILIQNNLKNQQIQLIKFVEIPFNPIEKSEVQKIVQQL
ncbi:unnamed protein product (macronuclear) [Paramecium tetraurelia]|uniref:Transmembrane protein n=1 Tax=Paramecium tetraurelia TaxID=5888 RepID=A0BB83_PARTE|nr:uncharacterized protein GSPATT00000235001 [Paramecium tetraurelia]CAK55800.1 unnamed protein product [Paramecium tetraurelia]|eukprot:XP_001423198.1 hypothetical protein (macronuclear) [Paramecium tetraurelia strain d4-2]